MRLIVQVGFTALMAAIGSSLGQQLGEEQGMKLGVLVGGGLGLLIIFVLHAGNSNK